MNYQFRKKPVVIEAFQMTAERRRDNSDWPEWLHDAWNLGHGELGALYPIDFPDSDGTDELIIVTLEGKHQVTFGDWIIRGVKGELYPCKPDIFAMTYDMSDENLHRGGALVSEKEHIVGEKPSEFFLSKSTHPLMQFFSWKHLPPRLQSVAKPFGELAEELAGTLPENAELTTALRKLLEAKDCALRAAVMQ